MYAVWKKIGVGEESKGSHRKEKQEQDRSQGCLGQYKELWMEDDNWKN